MRKYQPAVTRFLRQTPAYSRLSWINDVTGEDDYNTAAASLENLALNSEKDLWSHRVEISLAKLSKLATQERTHLQAQSSLALQTDVQRLEHYVEVDGIQDTLYEHLRPVWEGAIDRKAEAELALECYGGHLSEDRPSLREILSDTLSTLVNRQVLAIDDLVDLLTLIGPVQRAEDGDDEIVKSETHLALRVLEHGCYGQRDSSSLMALQRLIWRRCMIKDDWVARGKAAEGSNGGSDSSIRDTSLYRTLNACLEEGECSQTFVLYTSLANTSPSDPKRASYPSIYAPLSPADALMTDADSDILVSRFRPEQKSRLALDLRTENDILRHCVEVGKLDFWFQNLLEMAEVQVSAPSEPLICNAGTEI
jgi:nuclear pore complex protein Nup133